MLLGIVAAFALGAGVLVVEVLLARRGPDLAPANPYDLDGVVDALRPGQPLRTVWLGDSTAAGLGATSIDGALPRQVARAVAERRDRPVQVTSLAVSGARLDDVLDEQLPQLTGLEPDVVLISIGSNDVTHLARGATVRRQYGELLDALPGGAEVVALGIPDFGSVPRFAQPLRAAAGARAEQLDDVVADVARDRGAAYVDIAGETGPAFRDDPDRYFSADRYHPSDAGYARWAAAVVDILAPDG